MGILSLRNQLTMNNGSRTLCTLHDTHCEVLFLCARRVSSRKIAVSYHAPHDASAQDETAAVEAGCGSDGFVWIGVDIPLPP